jgi:regulator of replication initiation timing
LAFHIEEANEMKKRLTKLEEENEQLRGDQELNEVLVQQKVSQSQKNKNVIREVRWSPPRWIEADKALRELARIS